MSNVNATILVVDDEPVDIVVMRSALETIVGYTVLTASSYIEAFRTFEARQGDLDLLITDISMPFRTGIDLARTLLQKKPKLKVLFTSGYVGAEMLRASSLTAADRFFVPKPFTVQTFLASVQRVLESTETLRLTDTPNEQAGESATSLDGTR